MADPYAGIAIADPYAGIGVEEPKGGGQKSTRRQVAEYKGRRNR
jgi:hypothetical protein